MPWIPIRPRSSAASPGHEIEDLTLQNVHIWYTGGGTAKMAGTRVPEDEKSYPEPDNFGPIPAYGFFIRHVRNLTMSDVSVSFITDDERPPFYLDDVTGGTFRYIKAKRKATVPHFILNSVRDFTLQNSPGIKDTTIREAEHSEL